MDEGRNRNSPHINPETHWSLHLGAAFNISEVGFVKIYVTLLIRFESVVE